MKLESAFGNATKPVYDNDETLLQPISSLPSSGLVANQSS